MAQRTWRTICRAVKSGANNFSRMAVSLMSQYTPIRNHKPPPPRVRWVHVRPDGTEQDFIAGAPENLPSLRVRVGKRRWLKGRIKSHVWGRFFSPERTRKRLRAASDGDWSNLFVDCSF